MATGTANGGRYAFARTTGKQGYINVMYKIAQTLVRKHDEFAGYIASEKPDIVSVAETWVTSQLRGMKAFTKAVRIKKRVA